MDALFLKTQQVLSNAPTRVTLVTYRAFSLNGELIDVFSRAALSFWRSVRQEYSEIPMYVVDCSSLHEAQHVIEAMVAEPEVIVRQEHCWVPRLYREAEALAQSQQIPLPQQLCVRLEATTLNFRDILNAMGLYPGDAGRMGYEAAGKVLAVGNAVSGINVGDKVVLIGDGLFGTEVVVAAHQVCLAPKNISIKEAAALPIVYLTAHYALKHLAHLKCGHKVLIHAAAGGVGLAAIAIAQQVGATIYATASSSKQDYLRGLGIEHVYDSRTTDFAEQILKETHGQGVDVVLNSLTGAGFIEASVSCLGKQGFFLEISKLNIKTQEEMQALRSDISYYIIETDMRIREEPETIHRELQGLMKAIEDNQLKALPVQEFPIQDSPKAMRYLQQAKHVGKVVLTYPTRFAYSAEGTYWITGGAGGLGLRLAEYLITQGVRHLLLTGRSQATDALKIWIRIQLASGVEVIYEALDAADELALVDFARMLTQSPYPLKGVFHAAGILQDGLLTHLSLDDWHRVLAPKVAGAHHLDQITRHFELDFFVLFSSIASLLGSPGQSNYAAANGFMDGLAQVRRHEGFPAIAINWGPFAEVDMAAHLAQRHQAQGIMPLDTHTAFTHMDGLIQGDEVQVGLLRVDWSKQSSHPYLSHLVAKIAQESEWVQVLRATTEAQREQVLTGLIKQAIAEVLLLPRASDVDINKEFFDLGMDSLMVLELSNRLKILTGNRVNLSAAAIYDYATVEKLSAYIQKQLPLQSNALSAEEFSLPASLDYDFPLYYSEWMPLSNQQHYIWLMQRWKKYHISFQFKLNKHVDKSLLEQTLQYVIDMNPTISSQIATTKPLARYIKGGKINLEVKEWKQEQDKDTFLQSTIPQYIQKIKLHWQSMRIHKKGKFFSVTPSMIGKIWLRLIL